MGGESHVPGFSFSVCGQVAFWALGQGRERQLGRWVLSGADGEVGPWSLVRWTVAVAREGLFVGGAGTGGGAGPGVGGRWVQGEHLQR